MIAPLVYPTQKYDEVEYELAQRLEAATQFEAGRNPPEQTRREASVRSLAGRRLTEYQQQLVNQSAWTRHLLRLSPLSVYTSLSEAFCGVGLRESYQLFESGQHFAPAYQTFIADQDRRAGGFGLIAAALKPVPIASIPRLHYQRSSPGDGLVSNVVDIILLLGFNASLALATFCGFVKADVR